MNLLLRSPTVFTCVYSFVHHEEVNWFFILGTLSDCVHPSRSLVSSTFPRCSCHFTPSSFVCHQKQHPNASSCPHHSCDLSWSCQPFHWPELWFQLFEHFQLIVPALRLFKSCSRTDLAAVIALTTDPNEHPVLPSPLPLSLPFAGSFALAKGFHHAKSFYWSAAHCFFTRSSGALSVRELLRSQWTSLSSLALALGRPSN